VRCALVDGEVLGRPVDLVQEESSGVRFLLENVETQVSGLGPALARVFENGVSKGLDAIRLNVDSNADDVHENPRAIVNHSAARPSARAPTEATTEVASVRGVSYPGEGPATPLGLAAPVA
jgi:hypothetical protein